MTRCIGESSSFGNHPVRQGCAPYSHRRQHRRGGWGGWI